MARTNPRVFGELYDLHYPRIFGYVFRITGDYALACDITSETFLKAWIKIGAFQWKGISISSWFFRIASNEVNQYFRKKKYAPRELLELSVCDREALSKSGWSNGGRGETIVRLEQVEEFRDLHLKLGMLPVKYQQVIALRYFEEMSIAQIGEVLSKKEGTVKSLLSRGLDKLKDFF